MDIKKRWGGIIIGIAVCAGIAVVLLVRNRPEYNRNTPVESGALKVPATKQTPAKTNVIPEIKDHVSRLRKSVEDDPENVAHLKALAILLMDSHQPGEAIPYFEQALRVQPNNDSLLLDLSVCYFRMKKYRKALETTERILARNTSHSRALYNKGIIFAVQGKKTESVSVWKHLLSVAPASEEAQQARSELAAMGKGQ